MSELDQAFVSLGIADQRVAICERLVAHQIACIAKMSARGHDTREAERLLGLLKEMIEQWQLRRNLLMRRSTDFRRRVMSRPAYERAAALAFRELTVLNPHLPGSQAPWTMPSRQSVSLEQKGWPRRLAGAFP